MHEALGSKSNTKKKCVGAGGGRYLFVLPESVELKVKMSHKYMWTVRTFQDDDLVLISAKKKKKSKRQQKKQSNLVYYFNRGVCVKTL